MHVIDSHTGGEPTRVILNGGPDLGSGSLAERATRLSDENMRFCHSVLAEPRGQPAMVAALLTEPTDPSCVAGAIYFDRNAVLGMCGHGTIGLAVTLFHLGKIGIGEHRIETPAGVIGIDLVDPNTVTVRNVESRRVAKSVEVSVEGLGKVYGDVAYGGNWFFIVEPSPIDVDAVNVPALTKAAITVREAANSIGVGGVDAEPIDHVIFQSPHHDPNVHGRNFVLCPDNAYDRSPCGTGCSAILACLAADGRLSFGQEIIQQSIIGSSYRLSYEAGSKNGVLPSITGSAYVIAESKIVFDEKDPFRHGIDFPGS